MPKLVINPGTPNAWEIQLKPGANLLGRGFANDFKIEEPSVSGSHCQILVNNGAAVIKDLGSTNGTFVNRAPVQEAVLQAGHTVHLGGVEMLFQGDGPPGLSPPRSEAPPPVPITQHGTPNTNAPALAPGAATRLVTHHPPVLRSVGEGRSRTQEEPTTMLASPPPLAPAVAAALATGSKNCKFHPRTPGRFLCNHCHQFFCELCVTSRTVGGAQKKFCRKCGQELVPIQVQIQRAAGERGFFTRLPGVLIYPFKGSGSLVLIAATIVFAMLDVISGGIAILTKMLALGYLFSYMQNIIHCTAAEDDEMVTLPGLDGLFSAFFTLAGTVALCFGVPIGLAIAKFFFEVEIPMSALFATMILGCLYFPMAFLAVAMKDTVMAANPLVVIPAILKVPLEYIVTAILLTGVFGLRVLGSVMTSAAKAEGFATKDMSVLFMTFGMRLFWCFASVYLLTVGMRILGLLYVTKKQKFGWFSR